MPKNPLRICLSIGLTATLAILFLASLSCRTETEGKANVLLKFAVSFPSERSAAALDGRVLLLISNDGSAEPRFQVSDGAATQLVFGIDVDGLAPGAEAVIDASVFGYPLASLADLPAGEYYVQALLNRYETFARSDGHTIKLPPDKGEGQRWNAKPGNLYSAPEKIIIDPMAARTVRLSLNKEIPPIVPPKDTRYIKHVKIRSERLSQFWGRPMELGACLLLPEGFDEHPEARYPLIVFHGHFPATFGGFREEPPDPDLKPDYSDRFHMPGYNRVEQEYAHQFYKDWTGQDFPRVIVMEIQHANPYYDDSYAVNSANLGPYGDAIVRELIPYVEKTFRGLGQGWARYLYGGSTGGWEALAAQIFYPDEFNGCVAACPDPIDFRAYTVIDIYSQKNAYYADGPWKKTPRPGQRNDLGEVATTLEQANHRELALASRGRSGDQWDVWQAVFSPVGDDGYPKPIWDKRTGVIDPQVAAYWKEHYDLGAILRRDWKTLGPKLQGKIRIYVGDMDNFYLNNAVYLVESFLESTKDPYYAGDVAYGDRAEHCWNGDPTRPNALSRLRYHQMYIPQAVERMRKTAPLGADLTSWKY
ncbi:MAG: alpha/beta hydrolase-fold protein [Acidobacteriota bacterium]|nr:alpha/beta hydrolase-fold protein [Acidobacteriota bacterium]